MRQIRQGDVLLVEAEKPSGKAKVESKGLCVLAEGEATGHAHTIEDGILEEISGERYLTVKKAVPLRHQEHAAIVVEPGVRKVVRQREWSDAQEPRQVLD
jgi:hypothetical protein